MLSYSAIHVMDSHQIMYRHAASENYAEQLKCWLAEVRRFNENGRLYPIKKFVGDTGITVGYTL